MSPAVSAITTSSPATAKPPGCGTQNQATRDRWVRRVLAEVTAGSLILDAGAGELRYKDACSHLRYIAQDFARYDGAGDSVGLQMGEWQHRGLDIVADVAHQPITAGSFDAVLCAEVLEHVPAPVDVLRELVRVLRPGGTLILTAPFCSLTHFAPFFYQTGFGRRFYEHWLDELGVDLCEVDFNGNYFEYLGQELWRLPSIVERYANAEPTEAERRAMKTTMGYLQRASSSDQGSNELLAFGLHIKGRKR